MTFELQDTAQYKMYHLILSVFYYLYDLLAKLGRNYLYRKTPQNQSLPPPKNEILDFSNNRKQMFLTLFDEKSEKIANNNISDVFYDKVKYKETMEEYDNVVEKEWKRRMLIDHTPRGNVYMYYDPYKMGFAYYADNYIPYTVLNGVAMKYVRTYRCRDFFMDDYVVPEGRTSPLVKLLRTEDKKGGETSNIPKIDKSVLDNAPFAKLKPYNKGGLAVSQSVNGGIGVKNIGVMKEGKGTNTAADKKQVMNTFVYLGKTTNYSIIQKTPKQNTLNGFATSLVCSKKISWSQFKQKNKSE